jgi:hypothetical protein
LQEGSKTFVDVVATAGKASPRPWGHRRYSLPSVLPFGFRIRSFPETPVAVILTSKAQ